MGDFHHHIPLLAEIARPSREIDPDITVREVIDIFQAEQSLLTLPVSKQGRYLGAVNRKTLFFRHLGRAYAMELYNKKPIRLLMEENFITMGPHLDINDALARLLEIDSALDTDSFPIVENGRCLGIVSVSDLMMKISWSQSLLLSTLKNLSARIQEEVAKASKIQQDLLPVPEFHFNGITVGAGITTSSEIGGDFYDYFTLGGTKLGLIIADVSGHGVQAGMVTTAAKASLHSLISLGARTPAELLFGMNNAILATASRTLLMTCLIVLIDTETRQLTFANAGHNFPYLYHGRTKALEQLQEVSGFPLGFEHDGTYREFSFRFDEGDTLILYTDGIVECIDETENEFGYERLESLLREHMGLPPHDLRTRLLEAAVQFTGTKTFADDVTILIAAYRPEAAG